MSSAGTTHSRDYLAETPDGRQQPMLNMFHRDGDTISHFWGSELFYAPEDPGQDPRHGGATGLYLALPQGKGRTGRHGTGWADATA